MSEKLSWWVGAGRQGFSELAERSIRDRVAFELAVRAFMAARVRASARIHQEQE